MRRERETGVAAGGWEGFRYGFTDSLRFYIAIWLGGKCVHGLYYFGSSSDHRGEMGYLSLPRFLSDPHPVSPAEQICPPSLLQSGRGPAEPRLLRGNLQAEGAVLLLYALGQHVAFLRPPLPPHQTSRDGPTYQNNPTLVHLPRQRPPPPSFRPRQRRHRHHSAPGASSMPEGHSWTATATETQTLTRIADHGRQQEEER